MKLTLTLLSLFLLSSCAKPETVNVSAEYYNPYSMSDSKVWVSPWYGITRYENDEAVCYVFSEIQRGSIYCIPKSPLTK